ncbi:hypothetical protein C491_18104 [Natronococcus amylolyticus DSM 10524]|uniref:Uncharacterized protein n=1 Tax=Natronococcus amylolyticus DSM 10524 TaxID=1227497 RepID=L9WZG1_9EURY|nr:hypothetical protein [Natronococcus amylolyticus]ELY54541.1 hypothetical protein C491_18104 [Natronococcus amylolyticus DSM 10524]
MRIGDSVDTLSQIVDRYEADGGVIRQVDATISGRADATAPSVSVDVVAPLCNGTAAESDTSTTPETARLDDDGGLSLEFSRSALPAIAEYAPDGVVVTRDDARVTADGDVVVTFAIGFEEEATSARAEPPAGSAAESDAGTEPTETDGSLETGDPLDEEGVGPVSTGARLGSEAEAESAIDSELSRALEDARNEELPPYDDAEYLQCLYESFETFAAMADVLEMDVAAETVRRYMIDAGVHDPVSYDVADAEETEERTEPVDEPDDQSAAEGSDATASDAEPAPARPDGTADPVEDIPERPLVADGIGLPDDVEVEGLIDAVESAMTLYDVSRALDLERDRTRELLEELDLIDLVVRRVYASRTPEEGPSREEIAERIRGSDQHRSERRAGDAHSGDRQSAVP